MKFIQSTSALILLFLVSIQSLFAQEMKVPLHRDVVQGKFENGLKYYILENGKPENKVELRLVVNAGSILETDAQQGLAHFVEHMAFNGTKNFKKNELVDYLQSVGVKFGAHLNAYTSFDETVYMLSLPSDDQGIVEKGFQILGDWASEVSFDADEIDKERGVVLEEYRLRLGAENRMMEEYLPQLLFESHYAKRLPIGKKDVLENFEHEVLKDFYKSWYRPDLMAVIVVGDIKAADAEQMIKNHFAKLKNPSNEKVRETFEVPNHGDLKVSVVQDDEATRSDIQIVIKSDQPAELAGTEESYKKSITKSLYSSMFNARLREITNKPDAPFSYAWARIGNVFTRNKSGFMMNAIVANGKSFEAYEQMVMQLESVKRSGFTQKELDRALKDYAARIEAQVKEQKTTDSRRYLGGLQNHFLRGAPFVDADYRQEFFMEFREQLSIETINEFGAAWLGHENSVIIVKGSSQEEFPDEAQIREVWNSRETMSVEEYEETELPESLIDDVPQTGEIVNISKNEEVGLTTMKLSNGATVMYKKTNFKADQVLFRAFSKGGMSLVSDNDFHSSRFGMGVIGSCGVGQFSESDLEKMLSGKRVSLSPYISSISEGMRGSVSPDDMEELFQLCHLFFTQPRQDREAWDTYLKRQMSMTKNLESSPRNYYQVKWNEFTSAQHPRNWKMPKEADWASMDYNVIHRITKERFAAAGDFTFVFVGNVDEERLNEYVKKYLCPLPGGEKENFKDLGMRPKKGSHKLEIKKGSEPQSMVTIQFTGETKYSEEEEYYLKSLAEVLKIKLTETLREEMSGVYGTSAYASMNDDPYGSYSFTITFPCGPENVAALKERALLELDKLVKNGPSLKDLNKVKEAQLRDYKVNLESNRYWMNHFTNTAFDNGDMNSILHKEDKIKALNPENLKAVGKKYLTGDYLEGVLMPE